MTLELLLTEGLLLEKFSYFEYFIVSYAHAAIVPKYSRLKNMLKTIFFLAYYGIYFRNSSKTSRFISLLFFPIFKEIVFNIELKN